MASLPPPLMQQQQQPQLQQPSYIQQQTVQQDIQVVQPTVRVMRLYKPCLHGTTNTPMFPDYYSQKNDLPVSSDHTISPYLLFPDSFGDIYCGELFSAYIAVVNGSIDSVLQLVSLQVRLQTTTTSFDLSENVANGLLHDHIQPNDHVNMIVSHELLELGTYTLRVSVQFITPYSSETKTLRKFYRFNVVQPLVITKCNDNMIQGDVVIVQTKVLNTTKSTLIIGDVHVNSSIGKVEVFSSKVDSHNSNNSDVSNFNERVKHYNFDDRCILSPHESSAHAFQIKNVMGTVNAASDSDTSALQLSWELILPWYSNMGEHGLVKSAHKTSISNDSDGARAAQLNARSSANLILVTCLEYPSECFYGQVFHIKLRISNVSSQKQSILIQSAKCDFLSIVSVLDQPLSIEIPPGRFSDVVLGIYPSKCGLCELADIHFLDIATGTVYPSGSLCSIYVSDQQAYSTAAQ